MYDSLMMGESVPVDIIRRYIDGFFTVISQMNWDG